MHFSRLCAVLIDCDTSDVDEAAKGAAGGKKHDHPVIRMQAIDQLKSFFARFFETGGAFIQALHRSGAIENCH